MASIVVAGDTSGSVTIAAPAVSGTTTLNLPATTGNFLLDTTTGVCRAWVNFNGTGTVAIRASYNVSSITDNNTGDYTVNFTNAMPDANYTCVTMAANDAAAWTVSGQVTTATVLTSSVKIQAANLSSAARDSSIMNVTVFR